MTVKHQFFGKHRTNYLPFYFIAGTFVMSFIYGSGRLDNRLAQYQNTLIIIIGTTLLAAAVLQLKKMMAAASSKRYSKKIV